MPNEKYLNWKCKNIEATRRLDEEKKRIKEEREERNPKNNKPKRKKKASRAKIEKRKISSAIWEKKKREIRAKN